MENSLCLLCSQCGNLYDENELLPIVGSCFHTVCKQCYWRLPDFDCPLCSETNSFKTPTENSKILENVHLLRRELSNESDEFIAKLKENLLINPCSECGQETKNLRVCVECSLKSGVIIKQVANGNWIVECFNQVLFSNSSFLCSECILNEHNGHKAVLLQELANLWDVLEYEYFLKLAKGKNPINDLEKYRSYNKLFIYRKSSREEKCKKIEKQETERNQTMLEMDQVQCKEPTNSN
ncbi:unnamed protein product [Caenorhabditis brenneri]